MLRYVLCLMFIGLLCIKSQNSSLKVVFQIQNFLVLIVLNLNCCIITWFIYNYVCRYKEVHGSQHVSEPNWRSYPSYPISEATVFYCCSLWQWIADFDEKQRNNNNNVAVVNQTIHGLDWGSREIFILFFEWKYVCAHVVSI